ncbi:MAG: ester cyclase [SAR202 cluster bacterium]|nr:ester cyclase [SAR202 cluster bacterium]
MTQQDVTRVLKENIEAFNAGDWQRFKATLTQDSVYEETGTQRRIQGADEIVKADQEWRKAFHDARGTIRNIFASGNSVVAEITWEGTHRGAIQMPGNSIPASGKRVKLPASMVATVQGGKIKETRHYFDMVTMLQQVGAMEEAGARR